MSFNACPIFFLPFFLKKKKAALCHLCYGLCTMLSDYCLAFQKCDSPRSHPESNPLSSFRFQTIVTSLSDTTPGSSAPLKFSHLVSSCLSSCNNRNWCRLVYWIKASR